VRCDGLDRVATLARNVLERALVEADAAGPRASPSGIASARCSTSRATRPSTRRSGSSVTVRSGIAARCAVPRCRRDSVRSRPASARSSRSTLDDVRGEQPDAAELDDARLVEREDVLVRRIGLLGRVNPLALEEFQALEERHRFLSDQLNDLRRSRRDLEEVIEAVDERIRVVFKEAFDDVAREFELTFETVFPAGRVASCSPARRTC
jgi:chromosome segregation protein